MTTIEQPDWNDLYIKANQVFTPNTPISTKDLFSGRKEDIRRIIDVIHQKGQHAIIYGERGVGKTSLANVFSYFIPNQTHNLLSARVNGDRSDTFNSIWRKVFDELSLVQSTSDVGFNGSKTSKIISSKDLFGTTELVTPDMVRRALIKISTNIVPVLIIDEFDKLKESVRKIFSDLIKNLSDHALTSTVILIGVGDSVDDLIKDHQSVSRALVQVPMLRMDLEELKKIITTGMDILKMTIDPKTSEYIVVLSQGLPYYTHLLSLLACRDAIDKHSLNIKNENLDSAIQKALKDTLQSIRTTYTTAIRSAHKDNIFAEVIIACALAEKDELGTFSASDVVGKLEKITGKHYGIPAFARHLKEFCDANRENVLIQYGKKRKYRYKFSDPLMQPYVIMQGIMSKKLESQSLLVDTKPHTNPQYQQRLF